MRSHKNWGREKVKLVMLFMKILFVVLFFCVSVLAQEETILPYVEESGGMIDSAVLAADGKSFYTLKGDLVTHWQHTPVKRLKSFKTGIKPVNEKWLGFNIHITPDQRKLILNSNNEINLWSLETGKLIKRKKVNTVWGILSGPFFISVDENRTITKWDTQTLNRVLSTTLFPSQDSQSYDYKPSYMIASSKILVVFLNGYLVFLDLDTLQVRKTIRKYTGAATSINKRFIYYLTDTIHKMNIDTEEVTQVEREPYTNYTTHNYDEYRISYINQPFIRISSVVGALSLASVAIQSTPSSKIKSRYGFINNETLTLLGTFFQYEDGEWIMIDKDGYFEASDNAKKYLKMKESTSNPVRLPGGYYHMAPIEKSYPISNEIYKKYNKNIQISGYQQ